MKSEKEKREHRLNAILDALAPAIEAAIGEKQPGQLPNFGFALIVFDPPCDANGHYALSMVLSNAPKPVLADVLRGQANVIDRKVAEAEAIAKLD